MDFKASLLNFFFPLLSRVRQLEWFDERPAKEPSSKVVILSKMFTPSEFVTDPALLLDLKEEVRDECSKVGDITNVVLYDLEEDGVMSVRFKSALDAEACVTKFHGRFYAGRRIEAVLWDGKAKWKKSGGGGDDDGEGGGEGEKERLKRFEDWLEADG